MNDDVRKTYEMDGVENPPAGPVRQVAVEAVRCGARSNICVDALATVAAG
jgi:hypothetical protein